MNNKIPWGGFDDSSIYSGEDAASYRRGYYEGYSEGIEDVEDSVEDEEDDEYDGW